MRTLWQDLRYGARMLLKKPGFTSIAVITLSLGIGANTAIFSVVNAVLLRQLPYRDADRLVTISLPLPNGVNSSFSAPELEDIRTQAQSFEIIAGETTQSVNLTGGRQPERVRGGFVTTNFFEVFKIIPVIGRTFGPDEDKPEAERVVVVRESFWRRRMNGDPNLANKTLTLNAESYSVIGVVPETFRSPQDPGAEVWITARHYSASTASRDFRFLFGFGYLKPGVKLAQAQAELGVISERLAQAWPRENAGRVARVELLREFSSRGIRSEMLMLQAAVGFILLIACANLANLMLSRGAARVKEMTVRAALGAGRWRLTRQMLTESLLISLTGGGMGLLVAAWSVEPLLSLSPGIIPFGSASLDQRVVIFTFGVAVLTGVLSGLAPALQLGNPDLARALKEGGRASGENAGWRWARGAFVVVQIALSLTLLAGAGLLVRSFYKLLQVEMGFNTENLLTFEYRLPHSKYNTSEAQLGFHHQVIERVSAVPGVQSVALARAAPFSFNGGFAGVALPDRERLPQGKEPRAQFNTVTPGYLATLDIPLLRGRMFNEDDRGDTPLVYLINRTMAERFWPNEDPVGKTVNIVEVNSPGTIVGVIGDTKQRFLSDPQQPQIYSCYSQMPGSFATVVARTSVEPLSLTNAVREAVWKIDPDQPMWAIRTVEFMFERTTGDRRFVLALMGALAALALALATIGLYGVMSYTVAQRTREIGIRMAFGAQTSDIMKVVLKQGMALAILGVGVGMVVAFALIRVFITMLFEVEATDPMTFAVVALLLTGVTLLACYLPARRATKVDPMIALRRE
jgi:putative ABC transport system permease protein